MSHALECPTHSSVYSFSVSCPQAPHTFKGLMYPSGLLIRCHMSKCLTPSSAYSFSVSHHQVSIHSVSHVQVSHMSKCLTHSGRPIYPSARSMSHASHIRVSHVLERPVIRYHAPKCLTHLRVSHNHAYSFSVSHLQVHYKPSVSHSDVSHIQVPIHSVSNASKRLT